MFKFLLSFIPGVGPFLSAAGSFIAAHWEFFCVAAMVGMLAYQNFSDTRFLFGIPTIPHLQEQVAQDQVQIKQLTADLQVAAKANAALTKTLEGQNASVADWKAISDKLQERNKELVGLLSKMQLDNNKKVTDILNAKTPQTCEASIQFLRDMRQKLTW